MPGTEEHLMEQMRVYVGIDPTADSLHIGHLVVMKNAAQRQLCGHRAR
jgi:tyrosyl-tRNA synthetase